MLESLFSNNINYKDFDWLNLITPCVLLIGMFIIYIITKDIKK